MGLSVIVTSQRAGPKTHTHTFSHTFRRLEQAKYHTCAPSTHHLDGSRAEVQVADGCVVHLQDIDGLSGQGLEDGLVAVEGRRLLAVQDEAAHPAVELPGEQQADDGGLDVLLLILVSVEGILQVCRDVIWKKIRVIFYILGLQVMIIFAVN